MTDASLPSDLEAFAALRATVDAELAREDATWRFPPILEQRYEADRAASRTRELRRLADAVALYYPLIVLLTHFVARRQSTLAMVIQLILFLPSITVARRILSTARIASVWREGVALAMCCVVLVGPMLHAALAPADIVMMNMFFLVTPMIGAMFFARLAPPQAAGLFAFGVVGLAIVVFLRRDDLAGHGLYPLGALATSSAFALIAARELDRALRRLYLVGLRQTLDIHDLAAENRSLGVLSTTDPLTGAGNRRHFEKALAARRFAAGRFLLLVDIDHFKEINDQHGHHVGDACLREAVVAMRTCLRSSDTLARLGGDEFAVLLTGYTAEDARWTAEETRARVAAHVFEVDGAAHRVSVTIGGAGWDAGLDVAGLLAAADAALYQAKRGGRGCVAWAPAAPAPAASRAA